MATNQKTQSEDKVIPLMLNDEYFFKRGIQAHRNQDLTKAERFLARAVTLNPNEPVFICQLAIVIAEIGDYKRSNDLLLKIVDEMDPIMYEGYYFLANNYAHLGLFQEANKYVQLYIDKAPEGQFIEDAEDLLELLSLDSDDEDYTMSSDEETLIIKKEEACELLESGELQEAKILLEKLVKEYPEFWPGYNNLALAHFYLGEVLKGITLTEEVLQNSEGNLHALCNLAVFKQYIGKQDEVDDIILQLKKVYPLDIDQRYKLGVTFALLGEYNSGFMWLSWLRKHQYAGGASYYYWLAVSAYHAGNESFARETWKKVLELNPKKEGSEPWNTLDSMDLTNIPTNPNT